MTRALAYGRKSFDDPDRRTSSVEDQRLAAAGYAERHGLELAGFFGDNGITGATMERPGLQQLLQAITRADIGVLIIEDVDRLSRDAEHLHYMVKLLRLNRVVVHTVAAGQVDDLVLGFKAIIGEQQRARIAYTTRRGLKAKAKRGGATGGRTLGYAREITGSDASGVPTDRLVIQPEQAALVRRIFSLYAEGASLKRICRILNDEGVPSPRARETGKYNAGIWNPSTLSGDPALGEGILNNETYIGRRIFNRRTWVEVPNDQRGFRRQPRVNPEAEWIINLEPDLRIVDQRLWEKVKVRQADARAAASQQFRLTGNPLNGARRPTHLLSGLVECGSCGRPYLAAGGGRWQCKGHRGGSCLAGSIHIDELEERVLAGVRTRLFAPDLLASFAAALQVELAAEAAGDVAQRTEVEARLASVRSRIGKLVTQLEAAAQPPRSIIARLDVLEAEEDELAATLGTYSTTIAPALPEDYEALFRRAVTELDDHLAAHDGAAARTMLRGLIERVVVDEGTSRGGKRRPMRLHGDLYRLLGAEAQTQKLPDPEDRRVMLSLVAGTGFGPKHTIATARA